jgi:hypothetical protein
MGTHCHISMDVFVPVEQSTPHSSLGLNRVLLAVVRGLSLGKRNQS